MKLNPKNQYGVMLIDVLIGTTLMMVLLGSVTYWIAQSNRITLEHGLATHMKQVADATERYVGDHFNQIVLNVNMNTLNNLPTKVTISQLKSLDLLPPTFTNINPLNQNYEIYITKVGLGNLMAIILTTNGQNDDPNNPHLADTVIPSAAARMGARGGYVPSGRISRSWYTSTAAKGTAYGAYGTWSFDFTTIVPNPGAAHLVNMLYITGDYITAGNLYRDAVPGRPSLNRMDTNIDMSLNNIENVGTIAASEITAEKITDSIKGKTLSQSIQDATVVESDTIIPMPNCPSTQVANIYVAPSMFSNDGNGQPIQAVQSWAEKFTSTSWKVKLRVLIVGGWMTPSAQFGKILVLTKCT
ncbi:MAG: shufflon system plasmid conjugative transfer pilus tip adhesin PilV [Sedimenticola sp.]